MALPADYAAFTLDIYDLTWAAGADKLSACLSFDGGSTFLGDNSHGDSYVSSELRADVAIVDGTAAAAASTTVDTLMFLTLAAGGPITARCVIIPGTASTFARVLARVSMVLNDEDNLYIADVVTSPFKSASVVPTRARATNLRFGPYGDGDLATAPTGTAMRVAAGSYVLSGVRL
jgi:hypothetical protein